MVAARLTDIADHKLTLKMLKKAEAGEEIEVELDPESLLKLAEAFQAASVALRERMTAEQRTAVDFVTLETLYEWDDEQVLPFLTANPSLVSFLIEARPVIAHYFEGATCELEVDYDLAEDGKLYLYIVTELSSPESFNLLYKFDKEWWLPRRGKTAGKLSIHQKYIGDE